MLEMMLMAKMQIPPPDIRGDAIFTAVGTTVWTCPPDVFSISFVIIGGGENGVFVTGSATGGKGGGLRYRNNIPVVPGAKYNIGVGGPGGTSSAFGTSVGQFKVSSGPSDGGGYGGQGSQYSGGGTGIGQGGQGGSYSTGSTAGNQSINQYLGPDLYGRNQSGGYGSAGGASKDGGGSGKSYPGRSGACRIMWGRFRSFPNAAT